MSLFTRRGFETFVLGLPAVTLHEQWEACVAKVGGKVFALGGATGGSVVFKVSELAFEGLTAIDGIGQAPYFARRRWVRVEKGAAIPGRDLEAYIRESHRLVVAGLTRSVRAELGLAAPVPTAR